MIQQDLRRLMFAIQWLIENVSTKIHVIQPKRFLTESGCYPLAVRVIALHHRHWQTEYHHVCQYTDDVSADEGYMLLRHIIYALFQRLREVRMNMHLERLATKTAAK